MQICQYKEPHDPDDKETYIRDREGRDLMFQDECPVLEIKLSRGDLANMVMGHAVEHYLTVSNKDAPQDMPQHVIVQRYVVRMD